MVCFLKILDVNDVCSGAFRERVDANLSAAKTNPISCLFPPDCSIDCTECSLKYTLVIFIHDHVEDCYFGEDRFKLEPQFQIILCRRLK